MTGFLASFLAHFLPCVHTSSSVSSSVTFSASTIKDFFEPVCACSYILSSLNGMTFLPSYTQKTPFSIQRETSLHHKAWLLTALFSCPERIYWDMRLVFVLSALEKANKWGTLFLLHHKMAAETFYSEFWLPACMQVGSGGQTALIFHHVRFPENTGFSLCEKRASVCRSWPRGLHAKGWQSWKRMLLITEIPGLVVKQSLVWECRSRKETQSEDGPALSWNKAEGRQVGRQKTELNIEEVGRPRSICRASEVQINIYVCSVIQFL